MNFRKFLLTYSNRFISGYVVLASDILIVAISLVVAYIVRFNFDVSDINLWKLPTFLPIVVVISTIAFVISRSYVGIIRHTSTDDVVRIFKAAGMVFITLIILNFLILLYQWPINKVLPLSIIIIHTLTSLFLMIFTRLFAKIIWLNLIKGRSESVNVIIYGAGKAGILTKNTLTSDLENIYNVVCFLDDNAGKIGKSIEGVPVMSPAVVSPQFIKRKNIHEVIIAVHNIDPVKKREFTDAFLQYNVTIKNIPPVEYWINGELQLKQIRNVRIEDLLMREPIVLDKNIVLDETRDKVILVTGAAGSIGSEISRQLMHCQSKRLILLDQAETPLHDLLIRLRHNFPNFSERAEIIMADVSNQQRMEWIFNQYKPQIVYHAAAYKHVPMMEENPGEAVRVIVFGTRILADTAIRHGVEKFVMISTDKAVKATNVMGAAKRIAEMYIQSLSIKATDITRFVTTRFGNVLGSNGSVIPLFQQQIEEGGPVTVTHPEITRFFMTIPEACQLVLEAGAMGKGGEIYMFDMGKSVRIVELARNMIRLSGLQPDKDIKIVYTGLRPGEKLYEELLGSSENTLPTHHPRIMIAKVSPLDHELLETKLIELADVLQTNNNFKIVSLLKEIVPDYRSNNSVFEALDKPLSMPETMQLTENQLKDYEKKSEKTL
jgi:FlaA1/EpsC-like NDP-sugar epimerase